MSVNQFPTPQTGYPDPITQLWQGNPIAYIAGILLVLLVGLIVSIIIVKIKTPQLAWQLIKNNIRGGGVIIASIYENNMVKFFLPKLFQSSIAYDGEWFLFPKAYAENLDELTVAEKELLMSACSLVGAPGQLYFNYAMQCQVANPKLVAMIQHERLIQKLQNDEKVQVPKELFIQALNQIDDEKITISPINLAYPLNIKGLKKVLPQSLRKFDLKALENLVRDWLKGQGTGVNWGLITCILVIIGIIVTAALHFLG